MMSGLLSLTLKSCLVSPKKVNLCRVATSAAIQSIRKISFRRKKSESAAIDLNPVKSEYEIELDRIIKKENHHDYYGFYEDDPFKDKFTAHMLLFWGVSVTMIFTPVMVFLFGPDHRHRMVEWRKYEAVELMEAREARGELPLSPNFAPPELIESMVPPSGDWEEEWLSKQPSVRTKAYKYYWVEAQSW